MFSSTIKYTNAIIVTKIRIVYKVLFIIKQYIFIKFIGYCSHVPNHLTGSGQDILNEIIR